MKMKLLKKDYSSPHNHVFSVLYLMTRRDFEALLKKKCQCESSKKAEELKVEIETKMDGSYELR